MMYASVDAALVGILTGAGYKVYLDWAPSGTAPPYCCYNGNINTTPAMHGDGRTLRYERQAQIDYFTTKRGEDPEDLKLMREALNGKRVQLRGGEWIRVDFISSTRIPEPMGDNLAHHSITVGTRHSPSAG